ncbi:MAG: molybdopterin biosynthesis protein [Desulfatibacillaceae bacterium]|nr:molybdopterin biosynthesis protein [Desulfatibacillaceae bacterium]
MNKRRVYLKMKTRREALDLLMDYCDSFGKLNFETVATTDAVGRVLSHPAFAKVSSPACHTAAMDGIAVRSAETFGASESSPLDLAQGAQAVFVNTGNAMPQGFDAVVMIENVQHNEQQASFRIEAAAHPWQHVRRVGEDIVATQMLFPKSHKVSPTCINALLTGGVYEVRVWERPRVLVIPTGDEIVDWQDACKKGLGPGMVADSNSWTLCSLVEKAGGKALREKILPDDFALIRNKVESVCDGSYHAVLVLAGSSAGSADHTANVIESLGRILVHGVSIMPGKPLVIGDIFGVPIFGVPGYPVSAIVAFDEFIGPFLYRLQGIAPSPRPVMRVVPTRKIPSSLGLEELVRVKLGRVGGQTVATPLPRGAGSITSFTEADGIIRIEKDSEGIHAGVETDCELLAREEDIDRTLVVVGSHDNTLDLIKNALLGKGVRLSSAHVGSMGGLMAVKKGICHLAGAHLLDPEDGSYNISYIAKHLPNIPVALVHLAGRDQGLIVEKKNPKNIRGLEDLAQPGMRFVNRQAGSGTRILLDYKLETLNLAPENLPGYDMEEYTHMAVGAAVKSGAADAGMGILAAAKALDLSFVPVVTEDYQLVIPKIYWHTEQVQALLEVLADNDFKEQVLALGGYHVERMGQVTWME